MGRLAHRRRDKPEQQMAGERPSKFKRERDDNEHYDQEMQDDHGDPECAVFVVCGCLYASRAN